MVDLLKKLLKMFVWKVVISYDMFFIRSILRFFNKFRYHSIRLLLSDFVGGLILAILNEILNLRKRFLMNGCGSDGFFTLMMVIRLY